MNIKQKIENIETMNDYEDLNYELIFSMGKIMSRIINTIFLILVFIIIIFIMMVLLNR